MPSGKVTRNTFFGSFSGSIRTAATTGIPDSTRPSLPVKQTNLASASWPFRQNFVHGVKMEAWGRSSADDGFRPWLALNLILHGRRCVMGLGEAGKWQDQADRLARAIDALNDETLPFPQLADQFAGGLVLGCTAHPGTVGVRRGHRNVFVDNDASAGLDRHPQRQGDPQRFPLSLALDESSGHR